MAVDAEGRGKSVLAEVVVAEVLAELSAEVAASVIRDVSRIRYLSEVAGSSTCHFISVNSLSKLTCVTFNTNIR